MSLEANASDRRRINHMANTLVVLLQTQVPALARAAVITAEIIDRVREIVQQNLILLGSTLLTAGSITLLPSFLVTAVKVIGFTAGGVLEGSIAAFIQSTIFGGQTCGLFSVLQSFGATAMISPPVAVGVGVSLAVIGAGVLAYKRHCERVDQNDRKSSPDNRDDDDGSDPNSYRKDSSHLQVVKNPQAVQSLRSKMQQENVKLLNPTLFRN